MALTPGTRLGPYEVISQIGVGGMGEVYRATDTNLARQVAIKVLPEAVATDADRLARFDREAKTLASLNHPNIAAIYGVERSSGIIALVMELVEGPTLADRIAQGAIPVDEALPIAKQIAEALEAAHEQGIIHRDLKPANIKVRSDGTVKVLDFGLAKAMEPTGVMSQSASMSPTITSPAMMTGVGMILGTAAYMSPEQARGKTVDKRSDIWAFGCVLYEMLTGRRAFGGEEITDTLAFIIIKDIDWQALPAATPAEIRKLLRRCLEKDQKRRLPDIGVARLDVDEASSTPARAPAARPFGRRAVAAVVGSVVVGVFTGALIVWWLTRPAPQTPVRLVITEAAPNSIGAGNVNDPDVAISSDGSRVAYVIGSADRARVVVRPLDQLTPVVVVPEVTGRAAGDLPRAAFLSPDGRWVGFVEATGGAGIRALKKVPVSGGSPVTIASLGPGNTNPRGISWGDDGRIVFATTDPMTGLLRVSANGGTVEVLTKPDPKLAVDHLYPEVLPSANAVLYTILPTSGTLEDAQIALLNLSTGTSTVLIQGGTNPRYAASGHLLYAAAGALRAVPFNLRSLQITGDAIPVISGVVTKGSGAASFAVAGNGTLVYAAGGPVTGAERVIAWVDRNGHEELIPVPKRAYTYPRVSPDGERVALDIRDQDNDIWIWHFARQTLTRLTFERGFNRSPTWTSDGKRIAFSSPRGGVENVYWQAADGSGTPEALAPGKDIQSPSAFSSDSRWLFFNSPVNAPYDVGVIDVLERNSKLVLNMPYNEANPAISPDGRWLAYESDESGRPEIYVRPFPDVNAGRWQVSNGGGTRPLWSRDGRELFYFLVPGKVTAVPISSSANGFSAGNPTVVVSGVYASANNGRVYDVSPDGRRFLMIKDVGSDATNQRRELVVVEHWFEELKRLVPTK